MDRNVALVYQSTWSPTIWLFCKVGDGRRFITPYLSKSLNFDKLEDASYQEVIVCSILDDFTAESWTTVSAMPTI